MHLRSGRRSRADTLAAVPPSSDSISLYRRHRPGSFDEVVGQQHVVRTLRNAVEQGKVHHAYLFVGSRGTGKTSMAKILARSLNCERGGPTVSTGTLIVAGAGNGPARARPLSDMPGGIPPPTTL